MERKRERGTGLIETILCILAIVGGISASILSFVDVEEVPPAAPPEVTAAAPEPLGNEYHIYIHEVRP